MHVRAVNKENQPRLIRGGYDHCDRVTLPVFLLLGIMAIVSTLYPHLPMNFTEIYTLALNVDSETLKRTNLS